MMNKNKFFLPCHIVSLFFISGMLFSCAVGPDYARPSTEKTTNFKEAQNWKQAQPKDDVIRGKWWEAYNDIDLNALEEQVEVSNQNVKAAEAAYRQARALVAEARSSYFPTVSGNIGMTRNGLANSNFGSGSFGSGEATSNRYSASLDASWEPDLWGRIRRTVEENNALAGASKADLGVAKLSAQATLAVDYFSLRIADEQKRLLDSTVKNYERSLEIANNLYKSGINSRADYLQAKAQLETAQTQATDVGIARAQLEDAIAILTGKAPENFSIASIQTLPSVPVVPLGLPSDLLERRPDVAGAERRVIAANAGIGVAKSAFFPDITLSASGGYQSSQLANWFSLPNRVWSIGPTLAESLFDAGLRHAQTKAAIAAYDQTVANYRQTVLGSFQEVEDNLAALRLLEQEGDTQSKAVADSQAAAKIALNQYKSGIVSYTSVITAQNTQYNNEITALNIRKQRLVASANLIKALGGGWK